MKVTYFEDREAKVTCRQITPRPAFKVELQKPEKDCKFIYDELAFAMVEIMESVIKASTGDQENEYFQGWKTVGAGEDQFGMKIFLELDKKQEDIMILVCEKGWTESSGNTVSFDYWPHMSSGRKIYKEFIVQLCKFMNECEYINTKDYCDDDDEDEDDE